MVEKDSFLSDERGQFSFAFILLVILLGVVFLFFFLIPLMGNWVESWGKASDKMTDVSLRTANGINDANVRAQFVEDIENQKVNSVTSNEVIISFIHFSGLFVFIMVTLSLYLVAKKSTDAGMLG